MRVGIGCSAGRDARYQHVAVWRCGGVAVWRCGSIMLLRPRYVPSRERAGLPRTAIDTTGQRHQATASATYLSPLHLTAPRGQRVRLKAQAQQATASITGQEGPMPPPPQLPSRERMILQPTRSNRLTVCGCVQFADLHPNEHHHEPKHYDSRHGQAFCHAGEDEWNQSSLKIISISWNLDSERWRDLLRAHR